jgi:hypothetical protein
MELSHKTDYIASSLQERAAKKKIYMPARRRLLSLRILKKKKLI